jgi:hypothetical protein
LDRVVEVVAGVVNAQNLDTFVPGRVREKGVVPCGSRLMDRVDPFRYWKSVLVAGASDHARGLPFARAKAVEPATVCAQARGEPF